MLARRDQRLRAAMRQHGEPTLRLRRPGFEALVRMILEQQISVAAGKAVHRRLRTLTGGISAPNILALGEKKLLQAGLSRQKARYCYELASAVDDGELQLGTLHRHDDATCKEILTRQPGIGRWTAEVYLLIAMGRPDVWPAGDLALRQAQADVLGLEQQPSHAESDELAASWQPWRSVAARIMWHSYRQIRRMGQ